MSHLKRKLAVAVSLLGLSAAGGLSQEPVPAVLPMLAPLPITGGSAASASIADEPVSNQQLVRAVAQALKQSGKLHNYHMDIQASAGQVELSGRVADSRQKEDAVRLARAVDGVAAVRDRLVVARDDGIVRVQNLPEQGPPPRKQMDPQPGTDAPATLPAVPMMPGCPPQGYYFPNEPLAISPSVPNDMFQKAPPLPPNAWPTYAPYNNYSRVGYPTIYPQDAWPGIGPFYPFPKVPTGWRSVNLSWQDGYWWYGRGVSGHDWWRVRYK
jgi:hypothetical protein